MSITKQQAEEIKKRAQEFAAYGTGADRMRLYDYIDSITEPAAGQEALSPAPAQASVERDAARYRWLRDKADLYREDAPQVVVTDWMGLPVSTLQSAYPQGADLDAAVDAAIAAQHGEQGNGNG